MRNFYNMTSSEAFSELSTNELGLTEAEANKRLIANGENIFRRKKKNRPLLLFLAQFKDIMTILLICAAAITAVTAFVTGDKNELVDTGILLFIILLNTFVGFIQQYRADNAIEKLRGLSVCKAKVFRDGKCVLINSEKLVAGDVIWLEEGDMVPADCRIIQCEQLRCDESALTGESNGVSKISGELNGIIPVSDRKNMLYSSTFVVKGQAKAVVTATGVNTEIGKIASMLEESKPAATPLEKILSKLGKVVSVSVIAIAAVIFVFGIFFRETTLLGNFMASVAIAVAAIPEGMPAVVTIIMAMGVQKMSRERAVVKKLHAVETLGGCNRICSDKTGTLTENKMTVEEVVTDFMLWNQNLKTEKSDLITDGKEKVKLNTYDLSAGRDALSMTIYNMLLCNTVKGKGKSIIGDPTEVALVNYASKSAEIKNHKILSINPFTSERKMMSVAVHTEWGDWCFAKGGVDILLNKCTKIYRNGQIVAITEEDRNRVLAANSEMAGRALRVLGFAYKEYNGTTDENNLIFSGICGMIDPPRRGVKEAVEECVNAGIVPVMITGDHKVTAFAIAKRLKIAKSEKEVVTGEELDEMSEEELSEKIPYFKVFARVSPKHKSLIVKKLQAAGNVVAMTGDGINDAPSIKAADIGIAMGISGTDVTKSASDMVITDDNFSTVVSAVREGRRVFSNVKKTIQFFIATNLAEVLSILIVTLLLYRFDFLTSTQLLWINLITDSLPVLSLGAEKAEKDIMKRPPRRANDLFSAESVVSVLYYGIAQTMIVLFAFLFSVWKYGNSVAVTITFLVLSFLELFHSFNIRSERSSVFGKGFFGNKMLFLTVLIGILVNVVLCIVPVFCTAFGVVFLNAEQWLFVFGVSLAIIPCGEIYKMILRAVIKRRRSVVCAKCFGNCGKRIKVNL